MNALERLRAVLCAPDGEVVIDGTDADRSIVAEALKELDAALSQPAGVAHHGRYFASGPEGCFYTEDMQLAEKIVNRIDQDDDWTITDLRNPTGAAPAASGGDNYNGVTQPDGSGFRHGDNSVGALPEALPKPQVANPADTTYPSPPSGASQSSNPNLVTPGLSSEPSASVSESDG